MWYKLITGKEPNEYKAGTNRAVVEKDFSDVASLDQGKDTVDLFMEMEAHKDEHRLSASQALPKLKRIIKSIRNKVE